MSPYALTQEFIVPTNPSRIIELSPDTKFLCLRSGNLRLHLIDLATCSTVVIIVFRSSPSAVLWKHPHLLIVGMKNGTFTTVTIDEDFEVTFGQAHRTGASAHVSAIAMSDIHGILAIATGPIVRIYRFERGTLDFSYVCKCNISGDLNDHRARPVKSLVFSDTGDLFASNPTGVVCISPEPTNPSWTGAVNLKPREISFVEFRAAVRTSRIIDNRPLFLFNYGASGNRALFVGGGAWVVESTPNGDLVLKSTTSGSTVQEITCNLTFGATEADWPQIDGSRRLWPIGYRESEGKSFLVVSVLAMGHASVIEVWESGPEYQTARQRARQQACYDDHGVKAWLYRVLARVGWVGYAVLFVAACVVVYGLPTFASRPHPL